ncbi:hypothetical protein JG688_00015252 [Phytophthora aleatoria]|uniref:Protein kinase domain-containing protein n=1 Tax=Phytophthora aleatoria TaxID=2496075 RepID=A0A8J5LWZ8_9STRA|nr:hypothetical protein JG688_00015252 [Phytophthora aleatoria]
MSTNGESNAKVAANIQGITSTTNAQTTTTTTTDGNTQTTITDGNIQVTNSPETTSVASYNNQHTNGDSTVDTDNGGQSNGNGSQGGEGLGIPVIVGIVVGSVAVVLMIAAFVICRKEYGDRVYNHAVPIAVPISGGEYYDEITSTEILGRRSEMESEMMSGPWNDPEILEARIPMEKLRVQQLINRGGFGEVFLAILQMVAAGQLRLEISQSSPSGIYDLVMACTSLTPSDRPTAAKALERLQSIARETLTISSRGEETEFAL